jgi:dsDNA-specific endonuclease/ATPase MutS2
MNNTEQILEFDKIKELWSTFALTDTAKERILAVSPCLIESELLHWQHQTTEAKGMIETCGTPPIPAFTGILDIIETAQKESCLTAEQLETVANALSAVKRFKNYLNRCKSYNFSLAYYEENLESCDDIREQIQQQIRNGTVDDYATPLLSSVRKEIRIEDLRMHEKAEQLMRSNKNYMTDSFSTLRNGHICLPVKKEYRHKINGTVMDKSASGSTIFIEPASIFKHYETIQLLKIDEENEERRIRYTLTAMILDSLSVILETIKTIEMLDFVFSKGKFSLELNGIEPTINTERRIHLANARHPFLNKDTCVPISFDIGNGINGIIITGPNTGGKTVTIKTVALLCMMAQCGLHIPCMEADICMNGNYLCDIGDGQNLSQNLSTFSAHLKNILHILDSVTAESLVILDELGSGTDPAEGMGIAIAVLEALKKSNALFLVTTHYPEIKQYAAKETTIINARMDFDKTNLQPLYKLVIGESGESCALSIAKRLGMSDAMLKTAAIAAYGEEYHKHLPDGWVADFNTLTDTTKQLPKKSMITKKKTHHANKQKTARQFQLGDCVLVYPDKKIGIVCQTANEKGVLRVQLQNQKKIWINHKRLKLHVSATELYPEDYDFSIIFDTVENRKLRHQMDRKYVTDTLIADE